MHTVKVEFLQDYQGKHTGPHFFRQGQQAELELAAALALEAEGRVVPVVVVAEEPKRRARKGDK